MIYAMAPYTIRFRFVLHLLLVLALLAPGAGVATELSAPPAVGMDMPCHDPGVVDCCGEGCATSADCARLCAPALNASATATPAIPTAGWVVAPPLPPAPDVTLPLPLRPPAVSA
jgi:hypothetical protein